MTLKLGDTMEKEKLYVEYIYDDAHDLIKFILHDYSRGRDFAIGVNKYSGKDKHGLSFNEVLECYENIARKNNKFLKEEAIAQKQMEAWMKETGYIEPTYEEILERYKAVNYD